jgi:outer membrane protein assembly factor BamB
MASALASAGTFSRRILLAALSLAPFALTPAASAADDWVMAMHDGRHTGQTSEVVTTPLTLAWTWSDPYTYDTTSQYHPRALPHYMLPIFYQGKICFQGAQNPNRFFCLNPANGAVIWENDDPGYTQNGYAMYQFDNYPAAVNGRFLRAATDFSLSINANTAEFQNSYNTNGGYPSGGVAVSKDMGYMQFVRTDDTTEAFYVVQDPTNLCLLGWPVSADGTTRVYDTSMRVPAVDGGVVYFNQMGVLVAADAKTYRTLWTWGTKNKGGSPAVANGIVYFNSTSTGELVALDARHVTYDSVNGTQVPVLWRKPYAGANVPIVSDGVVYASTTSGTVYALNAMTGALKWSFWAVYLTSMEIPAISGNTLYVPSAHGVLYALDKNTGIEQWEYQGSSAFGPVVVANGMVFVSDLNMNLYAFRGQTATVGPAVSSLSAARISNAQANTISLTGSGFFAGGASSQVQSIQLDNPSATRLLGWTVASDSSITGIVVPAGTPAGTYHIRVQTSAAMSVNEPSIEVVASGSFFPATLGQTSGNLYGTQIESQRHLARTSSGNLVTAYAGPADPSFAQDATYNVSHDGGRTWTLQSTMHLQPWNNYVAKAAPTSSVWFDAQDHLNSTYVRWTSEGQSFEKFALNSVDLLIADTGLPVSLAPGLSQSMGTGVSQTNGRRWIVFLCGDQVIPRYSDDGGMTWNSMAAVNRSSSNLAALVGNKDQPAIVFNDGSALAWSKWNGTQWMAAQSLPGPISGVTTFSAVATNDGRLHVVYTASSGLAYVVYSGSAWSTPVTLSASGRSPSLTTDGTNLWCFYANASNDLVFQRTVGTTWNPAVAVTTDGNYNTAPSTLTYSPDASIPVIWTSGPSTSISVKSASIPASLGAPTTIDVTSQVKVTNTAFVLNRASRLITTLMTITNTGSTTINGPIQTVVGNLPAGVTLANAAGTHNGSPYITVASGPLAPGASAAIQLQFNDPTYIVFSLTALTYSGSF